MRHYKFTVAFTGYNIIYNIYAETENEAWCEVGRKEHFERWRTTVEDLGRVKKFIG